MKKKLLYLSTRQFWPPATGHEIVLYHNCKWLNEKYGYDVYVFCFADKATNQEKPKPDFLKEIVYVETPTKLKSTINLVKHSLWGIHKWPLQNDLYYDKTIEHQFVEYYKKIQPSVIFCDMARLVPYIEGFQSKGVKKILIAEDDLAKRYKRQLLSSVVGNTSGYYSNNMSKALNLLTSIKFVKNSILRLEIKLLESYESCFKDIFDYITFISPVETASYNERHGTKKALTLTMGADIQFYSQKVEVEQQKNSLVFVGNYAYAPNADSILTICKTILPKLNPNVCLYVVGKCPDELRKKIEADNVKVLGFVDDIRKAVCCATVYLSPIKYGTGIKTKIIEAMAMGIPVVTNSVGAESLAVESGKQLYIEDSTDGIVNRVETLLQDEALRKSIGEAGQKFVRENHSWEKVYEVFEKMGL